MNKREIKFRAWDGKAMYCSDTENITFSFDNMGWLVGTNMRGEQKRLLTHAGSGGILMQYTGLEDKNGKEIFEGDILKNTFGNYAVEYYDLNFQLENFDHYGMDGEYPPFEESEIIGNIYENFELIKK